MVARWTSRPEAMAARVVSSRWMGPSAMVSPPFVLIWEFTHLAIPGRGALSGRVLCRRGATTRFPAPDPSRGHRPAGMATSPGAGWSKAVPTTRHLPGRHGLDELPPAQFHDRREALWVPVR